VSTAFSDGASAIATILSAISGLKVYTYEPRDLDALPAVTIDGPDFARREPGDVDSGIEAIDLHLTYILRLYVARDDPSTATAAARTLIETIMQAVEANPGLNGTCMEAVLVSGQYGQTVPDEARSREMVVYECDLRTWTLVPKGI